MATRTIDMTPTFEQSAAMCIRILEGSEDPGALKFAREELLRYARGLDEMIAEKKAQADA